MHFFPGVRMALLHQSLQDSKFQTTTPHQKVQSHEAKYRFHQSFKMQRCIYIYIFIYYVYIYIYLYIIYLFILHIIFILLSVHLYCICTCMHQKVWVHQSLQQKLHPRYIRHTGSLGPPSKSSTIASELAWEGRWLP